MPTYVYAVLNEDGTLGAHFEIEQSMDEPHLEIHPETGEPVQRVYLPPNLATRYTEGRNKKLLDNGNIEKAGFTKYERDKQTGQYHRVAGKDGPKVLKR